MGNVEVDGRRHGQWCGAFRFNHMGVAVANVEEAVPIYEQLFGYQVLSGPFDDPEQQARVVFIGPPGSFDGQVARDFVLELIEPLGEKSHVARLLAKGGGAYHVCYEVNDIEQSLAELRRMGCLIVSDPVPAVAYALRRIAWFYTPTRQLVELVEK